MADRLASLTVHQLRVFTAVARARTYAEAAEALDLSVSTVAQHVQVLERTLGTRLVERGPGRRSLALTGAGRLLAESYGQVLALLDASREQVEAIRSVTQGVLHLGCGAAFGEWLLPAVHAGFRALYPQVELKAVVAPRAVVLQDVRRGRLDAGVLLEPSGDPHLREEPLGLEQDLVFVASRRHALARMPDVPLDLLLKEPLILPAQPSGVRQKLERLAAARGLEFHTGWEVNSPTASVRAAADGQGICLVPRLAVDHYPDRRDIAVLRTPGAPLRGRWYLARLATHEDPVLQAFARYLLHDHGWAASP